MTSADGWYIAAIGAVAGLVIGCNIGSDYSEWWYQREGVIRDYGSYCTDTGEWKFKGECEE